jgi:predicted nucleic acid-binding protein
LQPVTEAYIDRVMGCLADGTRFAREMARRASLRGQAQTVKTHVFDASALFVFLQKRAAANKVNELLKEALRGRADILMSAVNYGEVYGGILHKHGLDRAVATMSAVHALPIRPMDATSQRAFRAAEVESKYQLCYVDSFAVALAIEYKATLVTSDSDFRRLGHDLAMFRLKV